MSVFTRRSRTVNFRLSDAEFERLKSKSVAEGARSLSDYARNTVLRALGGTGAESLSLRDGVRRIDFKLDRLQHDFGELLALIGGRTGRTGDGEKEESAGGGAA